jgi:fibronectin type 3 domain-containing protein
MRKIWRNAILFGLGAAFLGLLGGCFLFAPPPVPTGVSASDGDYPDHILVSWNAARGAQRYEVFRAESEDGEYAKIGESTTTTFSDTEAQGNRLYWYRVRACNAFGCSALSEADSGYYLAPAPPLPPQNVQASDGTFSNRIRITWSASVGASYYELYRSDVPGADFLRIAQLSTTSYDDQGIVLGRTYYYKVKACNSYGCSDFSEADAGFAAASAPGAPQNVQASDGTYSDRVRITWDPVPGASRYEVWRSTAQGGTYELLAETTATSYDDRNVTVGTTYWYKVRAWNVLGYGPFSDPDSGYASAAGGGGGGGGTQLPGQVRGVSASDGTYPDKIRITWNSVSGAKTYRVYRSETGVEGTFSQIAEVPSGTTSYDDTTVTVLCQEYWYAVSAWNDAGEGPLSVPDTGYMGTKVTGVPTVSASQGTYADKIVLTWNEVPGPTKSTPVDYEIWRAESYSGTYTKIDTVSEAENADTNTTVTYEDKNFSGTGNYWEKTFWYRVKACAPQTPSNVCGCGGFSAPTSGYVSRVPAAPTSVSATKVSGGIQVSWSFTPRSDGAQTESVTFAVYRASAEAGPYTKIAEISGSPYTDTVADPSKTWWYKVQACNDYGCGPLSQAAKYTPSP